MVAMRAPLSASRFPAAFRAALAAQTPGAKTGPGPRNLSSRTPRGTPRRMVKIAAAYHAGVSRKKTKSAETVPLDSRFALDSVPMAPISRGPEKG